MEEETDFLNEMANLFRKTWTEIDPQAFRSWFDPIGSANNNPELDFITKSFIDYQQLQFSLLKLSFDVWQGILEKFESGEDWQPTVSEYTQKLRYEFDNFFRENLKNTQDNTQLWQIYIKQIVLNNTVFLNTSKLWIELNNFYWNLIYQSTFGSFMQFPMLDPNAELKSKLMRTFDVWVKLYPTSLDYQMVLAEIQLQSFEEMIPELIRLAVQGEKIQDWLEFQQIWGRTYDRVFEKAFCLEDNVKIRGRFLNCINKYKLSQQELMEDWLKMMNIPVRSEVDEVHKSIYELRKEVKSLKKTLAKFEEST